MPSTIDAPRDFGPELPDTGPAVTGPGDSEVQGLAGPRRGPEAPDYADRAYDELADGPEQFDKPVDEDEGAGAERKHRVTPGTAQELGNKAARDEVQSEDAGPAEDITWGSIEVPKQPRAADQQAETDHGGAGTGAVETADKAGTEAIDDAPVARNQLPADAGRLGMPAEDVDEQHDEELADVGNQDCVNSTVSEAPGEKEDGRERRDYMRTEGFVLVNHIGHEVMQEVAQLPVTQLTAEDSLDWRPVFATVNPSARALGMVTADYVAKMKNDITADETFYEKHGVTEGDTAGNKFIFENGFGDLEFTLPFSSGIANVVVETFERAGYISAEQRADLTLSDYADIIDSGWFHDVMHDLALTKSGIYVSFGDKQVDYSTDAMRNRLKVDGKPDPSRVRLTGPLFKAASVYDSTSDTTRLEARATDNFRGELRRLMKSKNSPGCPVARHNGSLPEELVTGNEHVQAQVQVGILKLSEAKNGRVHFSQEVTPIDRGLSVLSELLRGYDEQFGTPQWEADKRTLSHRRGAQIGIFTPRAGNMPYAHQAA